MIKKNYEFYFTLHGEEIKADYCTSDLYGESYCVLDNYYYYGVTYNKIAIVKVSDSSTYFERCLNTSLFLVLFFISLISIFYICYVWRKS